MNVDLESLRRPLAALRKCGAAAREPATRVLNLLVASLLLLLLLPVFLCTGVVVRATSPGPALFRQIRVGRHGQRFVMYKFRTMVKGAEDDDARHRAYVGCLLLDPDPPHGGREGLYKLARDPRVTRVGAFLRRTSLDELPQLFNVLRGDMALVGPRPALPWELELYDEVFLERLKVLPGITGLAKISGRNSVTMREALTIDLDYVRCRSFTMDIKILCKTMTLLFSGRNA